MSDGIIKYALTGYDAGVAPSRMGTLVSLYDHLASVDAARAEIERLTARAAKAEAERDEALAQVAAVIEKAANIALYGDDDDPDWLMNRAESIRALTPAHAKAALEAYGREKVREGMQRAADLCKPAKAKMDWGNKWEPARKNPQSAAAQGARKQCYNAILAAMEKEGGE